MPNNLPVLTAVPVIGATITSTTADTGYGGTGGTAPTHGVTVLSGSTNGTRVEEINVIPTGTVAAGVVNLFLYDGTTYWLYDQVPLTAATLSQTALQVRWNKVYPNLVIPSGWSLVATCTTAQSAGLIVAALSGTF